MQRKSIHKFLELNHSKKLNIAVVGDSLVDEFYNVKVNRISPESPTKIMHSNNSHPIARCGGGAANVSTQLSKWFNVNCFLLSFIDNFAAEVFKDEPFDTYYCVNINSQIPIKKRFYDEDYPLTRWDIEEEDYGLSQHELQHVIEPQLISNFDKLLNDQNIDIVILSDYGKGIFKHALSTVIIDRCKEKKIPTIVDPKDPPIDRWFGCDYFKPNAFEACKMTGIPKPEEGPSPEIRWYNHWQYFKKLGFQNVIITDGPNTPFITYSDKFHDIKLVKNPIKNSVVGAGDAFCAFLAMCLGHQLTLEESVEVSWNASSLYIESKHNKPLFPYELAKWNDPISAKLIELHELIDLKNKCYNDQKWGFSNGCFDLAPHYGHISTLQFAKSKCDKLIVAINSDESVSRLKGKDRPIISLEKRMKSIASLECVDFVISFKEDDPGSVIEQIVPNVLIKGSDYIGKEVAGKNIVKEIYFAQMIDGISTTQTINKIKNS